MKFFPTLLLTIAVAAVSGTIAYKAALHGPKQTSASAQTVFERVRKTGVLRCAYALWPPAMNKDATTGELSGINYDVMQLIGEELDVKIEWTEEVGFGNYIEGLETERYDALCSTTWPDPARIRYQTFTNPYYFTPVYAYVRADDMRFDGHMEKINDPGVTISTIDGDISSTAARIDFPKAKVFSLPQMADAQESFVTITTKKADVYFSDDGNFNLFDKNNPGQMRKVPNTGASRVYGEIIAVKSGETQLRDMMNVALMQLINSGKVEEIINRTAPGIYLLPAPDYKAAQP